MLHRYEPPAPTQDTSEPAPPPGPQRVAVSLPISEPRLTYVLLAIIVVIYGYFFTLSGNGQLQFLDNWAKVNSAIRAGEYYRLVTSMFLHLSLMHILFNGYALYILGRDVEALFGTVRFAAIYFLGGLSGSLASFVFTSAPSAGASGAIFAVFGAEMVYFYQHRDLHGTAGRRHLQQLAILMVINLALGFSSGVIGPFRIDNAGHIGGIIGGVVLAWFIGPHYQIAYDPTAQTSFTVVDRNPIQRWALPVLLYTVGLLVVTGYAVMV